MTLMDTVIPGTCSQPGVAPSNVLIFRDRLLPFSETFILEQSEAMRRYKPYYVGLSRTGGLPLPEGRSIVLNERRQPRWKRWIAEQLFQRTGWAPGFYSRLGRLRPALVHAHFGPSGMLARGVARRLGIPLVVQFWGYDATVSDQFLAGQGFAAREFVGKRRLLEGPHCLLLAVSSFIRDRLVEKGMDPKSVQVHYTGVDVDRFAPDPAAARDAPGDLVLFVGRLVEKKGLPDLIAAMWVVQQRHPSAKLVVVGDGPMRRECEEASTALRHCTFVGSQPPDVVLRWMQKASLLCAPSRTAANGDCEGLNFCILEAQSCALPVVSTLHAGIPEAVQHGKTGLLAHEGDVAELGRQITWLLDQPNERVALGTAARNQAIARFNLNVQSRKLEGMYDRLLSRLEPPCESCQV